MSGRWGFSADISSRRREDPGLDERQELIRRGQAAVEVALQLVTSVFGEKGLLKQRFDALGCDSDNEEREAWENSKRSTKDSPAKSTRMNSRRVPNAAPYHRMAERRDPVKTAIMGRKASQ